MATGRGSGSISIGKGSDMFNDFSCSPCSKEGNNVEAIKYCVECEESLCSMCLKFHNRFERMREHQLLDQVPTPSKGQQGRPFLPKEKCLIHRGKAIDMYCGTHDVVCCTTCIAVSHRPCQDVEYIPHVANTLKKSQEVSNVKFAVNKVKSDIEKLKKTRKDDLKRIGKQKSSILTQINDFRNQINKQLDEMEKTTKYELQRKHQKIVNQINADLKSIGEIILTLEKNDSNLTTSDGSDESHLFVYVKQSKANTNNGEALMEKMKCSAGKKGLLFDINKTITDMICDMTSLGTFPAYKLNQYNVKVSSDKSTCDIKGSCILGDDSIVINDFNNKKIKKLDKTYNVVAECDLPVRPHSLCSLGTAEVAISLHENKKIQFASVTDSISLTKSFPVGDYPRGVAYSDSKLYVSCGGWRGWYEGPGHLEVYNTAGTLLQSFTNYSTGKQIFSIPFRLAISSDGKQIHIADHRNGLITLDRTGTIQQVFTDPELECAYGVCVTGEDSILVSGHDSDTVIHVDSNGQKKAVLLAQKDRIYDPWSLCYDKWNHRLIVTMNETDHINVYDMLSEFDTY